MGRVELRIAAQFYPGFEKTEVQLAESCTLYRLLEQWSAEHAPGLMEQLFNPDTLVLREGVLILINGKAVQQEDAHSSLSWRYRPYCPLLSGLCAPKIMPYL